MAEDRVRRRLAAILAADLAGYSSAGSLTNNAGAWRTGNFSRYTPKTYQEAVKKSGDCRRSPLTLETPADAGQNRLDSVVVTVVVIVVTIVDLRDGVCHILLSPR